MIDHTNVTLLKSYVTKAEQDRVYEDHPAVEQHYDVWLGDSAMKNEELVELSITLTDFNPELDSLKTITDAELFAVGLLGLQRIYLDSATSEYLFDPEFGEKKLLRIAYRYQQIFQLLEFTVRFPFTIHGGVIDWVGEYYQDLAHCMNALGRKEKAEDLLEEALRVLGDRLEEIEKFDNKEQTAATLSSIGVLHLRKGRLDRSVKELLTGGKLIKKSHSLSPNPQRKKDTGKMLIRESARNILRTNPLTTVRAAMLGTKLLLQK